MITCIFFKIALIDNLLQHIRPAFLEKKLKCIWLHHNNPYLFIGPFKFEFKNHNPEIGLLHDFMINRETQDIQKTAHGRMKSTPFTAEQESKNYHNARTSKVMYMNENLVPEAMVFSKRIELATRFNLNNEQYASENFQVMNYGIGGKISLHADTGAEYFGNYTGRHIKTRYKNQTLHLLLNFLKCV